jgi:competence CoiA-like predicted nuclease
LGKKIKDLVARRWGADLEVKLGQRRADCLDEQRKLVIEVQCSPLSVEEFNARNRDYARLGYKVVWVWDTGMLQGVGRAQEPLSTGRGSG